jgi:HCOMODA/2-hydroxy-3-carboxy-muconic semialdehyde decarboxylase
MPAMERTFWSAIADWVRLAEKLAGHSVVLMRGHGATVVGTSIRQAVVRSVYAETNAKLQFQALSLSSDVVYLTEAEAETCSVTIDGQLDRAWNMWKAMLDQDG